MRRTVLAMVILGVLLLALPTTGTAQDRGRSPRGKTVVVKAAGSSAPLIWGWDPPEITIRAGDRVRWENPTGEAHSVRPWVEAGSGSSLWAPESTLEPDGSFRFTFTEPGVYRYRCGVFPHSDIVYLADGGRCVGMCGTITVE